MINVGYIRSEYVFLQLVRLRCPLHCASRTLPCPIITHVTVRVRTLYSRNSIIFWNIPMFTVESHIHKHLLPSVFSTSFCSYWCNITYVRVDMSSWISSRTLQLWWAVNSKILRKLSFHYHLFSPIAYFLSLKRKNHGNLMSP